MILSILVIPTSTNAYRDFKTKCERNPIYCQILKNNPKLDKAYAFKLSNVIILKSIKYDLNPRKLTAIFAQESMYKLDAKNCTTGYEVDSGGIASNLSRVCTDFGIGQIHHKTAKLYKFEVSRLTSDMDYSVEAAAIVLSDFKKRYKHKEKDWWTRYNANNMSARNEYKRLVERFNNAN